jgi:DNA (cytosine-5)-methyltransferase 1
MAEIVEPFGGPGGWSEALRRAGIEAEAIGFDLSADACATAQAAGHRRECVDISTVNPPAAEMTIASPPCWAWSTSGLKRARGDRQIVMEAIASYARGDDRLAEARREVEEPTSLLVVEPLRWALMSGSRRLLLEQVPSVLPCWQVMAEGLRRHGYSVWTGIVEAADYGVPQTRQRAVLIASRAEPVRPPVPTHTDGLAFTTQPWRTMDDVTDWPGRWLVGFPRRNDLDDGAGEYRLRDRQLSDRPAFTVTEKARSWTRVPEDGGEQVRISLEEAAAFQTFPASYPWAGSRTSRFRQCADAVPPQLAAALLGAML